MGFGLGAHEPKAVRISKLEVKSAVTAQLSPDRSDLVIFANDDFVALETQFKSKRSFKDAVQIKNPIVGEFYQRIQKIKKEVVTECAVGASRTVAFKIGSQNEAGEFTREVDLIIVSTKTSPILLSVQVTVAGLLKPAESLLNAIKSVADESTFLENHGGKLFGAAALACFYMWKTQNYPAVGVRAYDWVFADKPMRGMDYDRATVEAGIKSILGDELKDLSILFWDEVKSGNDIDTFLKTAQPKTVTYNGFCSVTYKGVFVVRLSTLVDGWRLAGKYLCRNADGGFSDRVKPSGPLFFSSHSADGPPAEERGLLKEDDRIFIKNNQKVSLSTKDFCSSIKEMRIFVINDLPAEKSSRRISSRYWGKDTGVIHYLHCGLPRQILDSAKCDHVPSTESQILFDLQEKICGDLGYTLVSVDGKK